MEARIPRRTKPERFQTHLRSAYGLHGHAARVIGVISADRNKATVPVGDTLQAIDTGGVLGPVNGVSRTQDQPGLADSHETIPTEGDAGQPTLDS